MWLTMLEKLKCQQRKLLILLNKKKPQSKMVNRTRKPLVDEGVDGKKQGSTGKNNPEQRWTAQQTSQISRRY